LQAEPGAAPPLEQTLIELDPGATERRASDECEEVLFVVSGRGSLKAAGAEHGLEPETGAYLAPGEEYELRAERESPMRVVSVRIPDPVPPEPGSGPPRAVVRRLADQDAGAATTDRWFRILGEPDTGLRSATHFVGYIPPVRAPDHFHTYDEVIYVIDGVGLMHVEGGTRSLESGSTIELAARTVHCLENTGADVMRIVAVFRPAGSPAAAYYPDGTPAEVDTTTVPAEVDTTTVPNKEEVTK
jgi:mannose-6-phosphate isomerase-like protein (cupin superfamily)